MFVKEKRTELVIYILLQYQALVMTDDVSDSEQESDEDLEDFSEEDHNYLVTSVDNLRRRELIKLEPRRTRSKVAAIIKGRKPYKDINHTGENETNDEDWIQENFIDPSGQENREDKVLYAEMDAIKLKQFLKQEQEGIVRIIKKKCL